MQPIGSEQFYAEIAASTATIASLLSQADPQAPVPTCPDWTMRNLATHVGRAHRWAGQIVATRSAEFIPFQSVPDGKLPADRQAQPGWLHAGAQRVIDVTRQAGQELVWTFAGLRPASFWARRMAHETIVHRADAELAAGRQPVLDPRLAADAIDEWLGFQSGPVPDQPGDQMLPDGRSLHVHVTDDELAGTGEWLVRRDGPAVTVSRGHAKADVAVRGPAARLLLVLVRRLPADDPAVGVLGDGELLAHWLGHTPF